MTDPLKPNAGVFLMGNEAIVRGALEAGVQWLQVIPAPPPRKSSDPGPFGPARALVEWSINETVAMEVAAAASWPSSAPSVS